MSLFILFPIAQNARAAKTKTIAIIPNSTKLQVDRRAHFVKVEGGV
jgi:hypothetical protein